MSTPGDLGQAADIKCAVLTQTSSSVSRARADVSNQTPYDRYSRGQGEHSVNSSRRQIQSSSKVGADWTITLDVNTETHSSGSIRLAILSPPRITNSNKFTTSQLSYLCVI